MIDIQNGFHYVFARSNDLTPPAFSKTGREAVTAQAVTASAFLGDFMKTNIYVDGFNLYYGALKGTPYKWLNVAKLCQALLPKNQIHRIKYFTAHVNPRPNDPAKHIKQQAYFRALRTLPNLEIILGHFLTQKCVMPLAGQHEGHPKFVKVIKTEEKGSDVNLAVHLLNDGHKRDYEVAVLITNDSDLLEAIRIVRYELRLPVGILNPYPRPSHSLQQHASFIKPIRKGALAASQFPDTLVDANGTFRKPASW
jgi:uncharacterized LabA/DUF88 family protein